MNEVVSPPFTDTLRELTLPPLSDEAARVPRPHNAHIHLPPNFSAFAHVSDAVAQASAEGIALLGASNYYDWSVYETFANHAAARGIFPLFGLETICLIPPLVEAGVRINDPGNPGKMYLCGKGFTDLSAANPEAAALLETVRGNDRSRMAQMSERLTGIFADAGCDTGLTADTLIETVAARAGCPRETVFLQERHLAQGFADAVFARVPDTGARTALLARAYDTAPKAAPDDLAGTQNDIRSLLMKAGKPAFVPDTFVDFDHAFGLIRALGGLPVYPILADGADPICPYEADLPALIADLKARGIVAAEFIPPRNDAALLTRYALALREAGLFVTAGTEHNTPDQQPLTPTCKNGVNIPPEIASLFWEGACVVAAHQWHRGRGEPGYDTSPAASGDAQIRAFAREGAAVIAAFASRRTI